MTQIQMFLVLAVLIFAVTALGQETKSAADASGPTVSTSGRAPGTVFRDCPDCPEMVMVPEGNFTIGSSDSEKSWAASHGGSAESVADGIAATQCFVVILCLGKVRRHSRRIRRVRSRYRISRRRRMF